MKKPKAKARKPRITKAKHYIGSCDFCVSQEAGRHYCLLHGIQVKNMDTVTCKDFEGAV